MKSVRTMKRAHSAMREQSLAMPPGFKRVFSGQKLEQNAVRLQNGNASLANSIQDTDPTSATFGQIAFMLGYDGV